jgi:hypothetical protein
MPAPKPSALLKETDEKLFSAGACHIFARELIRYFHEMDYEPWCMESEQWVHHPLSGEKLFSKKSLVHVFVRSGDQIIDIHGVRPLEFYLEEYRTKNRNCSGPYTYVYKTYTCRCDLEELFFPTLAEDETGPMNKDRLYLDSDFVADSTVRSRKIITNNRERFLATTGPNSAVRAAAPSSPSNH